MSMPLLSDQPTGKDERAKTRKPSSADVARLAGVSRSTVSVVLNGHREPIIAEATRERVLESARALNYRPNQLARALIMGSSRLIGLWMWSLPSPYDVSLIQSALTYIRKDGFQSLLFEMVPDGKSDAQLDPAQWPIDGIITEIRPEYIAQFLAAHPTAPPMVTIGVEASSLTDFVRFDITGGVLEALEHLTATGRRRIAFVTPAADAQSREARQWAYLQFQQAAGRTVELIHCDFAARSRENVMQSVQAHIAAHGCPDGLLCYNDEIAIAVNRSLRESGIAVPREAAIVGCDGWVETEYQNPPLSTIRLPLEEACRHAWDFLKNRIADPDLPPQQITLPTHLVVRGSSV